MKFFKSLIVVLPFAMIFACCNKSETPAPPPVIIDSTVTLTHPDHIVFIWFENKNYDSIVNAASAPYINSLINGGTLFTNMLALTHPSYPNYVDFFSGDPNGVESDQCITGSTLITPNLYTQLITKGKSFAWYSEDLPAQGSGTCRDGEYVEKHNPTTIFANVPDEANKPFSAFPTDFSKLENVVCISPNLVNDMHDSTIAAGDNWLKNNLSSYIDWCKTHNSIFVVYFDENDRTGINKIPVVAIGQHVKVNYKEDKSYDHYSWTRTICDMFSASNTWTPNVKSAKMITGCWK